DDFWIDEVVFEYVSTWDAIQSFALQSDKDIRYLLNPNTNQFRLTYWTPDQTMTPGWTIGERNIIHETLETSDANNRYRVTVRWRDSTGELRDTTVEAMQYRKPNEPVRHALIEEGHTTYIKDEEAALRFARAVLNAVSTSPATDRLVIPYNPYRRVFDLIEVENSDIRSEKELYAIEELVFNFTVDDWTTEIIASETVKIRPKYWLSIEAKRGLAGEPIPPEEIGGGSVVLPAPENVVVSPMELGIAVHVPVPPVHASRWSITEVHVSTQQGFTPSPATRMAANRSTYIPVTGLQPGTTYYVRAVYVDINGRRSQPSAEYSATPTYITGATLDANLFAIEPSSTPAPSSGNLEDLWDMDTSTGVTFPSAPITITFRYPVYQGSDLVELHLQAAAQGYVQMRQRDTGNWINVLGSPSSPVPFVAGWNRQRFSGNKLYFGREYRLVLLDNVRVNELRFERVTVADLILAGKLRL